MSFLHKTPAIFIRRIEYTKNKLIEFNSKIKHFSSKPEHKNKNSRISLSKIVFNLSFFNRYGLFTHDVINYDLAIVREALLRVPKDILDERSFRIIRAINLDQRKIYLPKEEWVTYEQDLENRYLSPHLEDIIAEKKEIMEFGCANYNISDWPSNEYK